MDNLNLRKTISGVVILKDLEVTDIGSKISILL